MLGKRKMSYIYQAAGIARMSLDEWLGSKYNAQMK